MKRVILYALALMASIALTLFGRYLILDRAKPISLQFSPISYVVAKSLQGTSANYLPIESRDYSLGPIHYFDSKQWVVVSVIPLSSSLNSEVLVLNKQAGSYKTVYGPSNFLLPSSLTALPGNVAQYLESTARGNQ